MTLVLGLIIAAYTVGLLGTPGPYERLLSHQR